MRRVQLWHCLASDELELARRRLPWHGGAVRRGPAISGGRSGWSKGARVSQLRGECSALHRGVNEAVGRQAHGGGAMVKVLCLVLVISDNT
jgi:hypothetical protein